MGRVVDLSCSRCVPTGQGKVPGLCCTVRLEHGHLGVLHTSAAAEEFYQLLSGEKNGLGDEDGYVESHLKG